MLQLKEDTISWENIIAILALYRDEWKHREEVFISYFWRFTYLSLIITFFPALGESIGIIGFVTALPSWIFSVAGIICSLWGLYFGLAENKRITKLDLAYRNLEKIIPKEYRIDEIEEKHFKPRLSILLCFVIYGVIILLAIVNICYSCWF